MDQSLKIANAIPPSGLQSLNLSSGRVVVCGSCVGPLRCTGRGQLCPRQCSVIYVTWVWFFHKRKFQGMVNCWLKSGPWSPFACSSAVLWGFFLVLFFCLGPGCSIQSLSPSTSLSESTFLLILLNCFTTAVAVITRLLRFG